MANNFKLFLELKRQDTKEHVRHKIDGQRFGHTNTVKLNVNTMYDVRVTVRPALRLHNLIIYGEKHDVELVKASDNDEKLTYCTTYHTGGHNHSKKGGRKDVPFLFELEHGLSLKTQMQCKFYNEKEVEHSKWGNTLTSIEYDCKVSEGHTYVTVTKERYL